MIATEFRGEDRAHDLHVEARMTPRVSPYAPPAADLQDPVDLNELELDLTQQARRAFFLALAPFGGIGVAIVAAMINPVFLIVAVVAIVAGSIAGWYGLAAAIRTTRELRRIDPAARPDGLALAIFSIPLALVSTTIGALGTLLSLAAQTRGRQLRVFGEVKLAPIAPDTTWTTPSPPGPEITVEAKADVADAWRQNGLTEHASVAAFARLSMELVALGAPPSLIQGAHEDALDEMRHTTWCFDLAKSLDGKNAGPKEFPAARARFFPLGPRSLRLARLAVESLIDGALNEGISARVVGELSREVTDPKIKEMLAAIARDEGRHAAHGFDIVKWCVEEGGYPVRVALRSAIATLPAVAGSKLAEDASDGRWEKFGIPSRAREERAYSASTKKLAARTERLLASAIMPPRVARGCS